jgi:type IV secretory pathway TrbD component
LSDGTAPEPRSRSTPSSGMPRSVPALWPAEHDQHSPSGEETRTLTRLLSGALAVACRLPDLRFSIPVVTIRARCTPPLASAMRTQCVPVPSGRGRLLRRGWVSHTVAMRRVVGSVRLVVAAAIVVAVALGGGLVSWRAASATTRVMDRSDPRFDVLVQRRTERLGGAGAELQPPDGQPQLTAGQAWSAVGPHRQPNGRKPSVRLATFADSDFPVPAGPSRRLVPVAKRALVWVLVVPDVPLVDFGPDMGLEDRLARRAGCPTYTPVDASTGDQLGTWHHC